MLYTKYVADDFLCLVVFACTDFDRIEENWTDIAWNKVLASSG